VEIKHISRLSWNDLPKVESPFFARDTIRQDRSTTLPFGISRISGLNEALEGYGYGCSPYGSQVSSREAFDWLLDRVDDGEFVLLDSNWTTPMSPVLRWSTEDNSNGYRVPLLSGSKDADYTQGRWRADSDLPMQMRSRIDECLEKARRSDRGPEHLWWGGFLVSRRGGGGKSDVPPPPEPLGTNKQPQARGKPPPVKDKSETIAARKDQPMPAILAKGTADAKDVALVRAELEKMPEKYRQMMVDNNTKVIVVRGSITEYYTDLKGVQPRGWDNPPRTWDTVPGAGPRPGKGSEMVIATRGHGTPGGPYIPPYGDGHGSQNLVLHEAAHTLDRGRSSTQAFQNARTADLGSLSDYEKQPSVAGLEETFAESFANAFGGNTNYANTHPNLDAYWKGLP